MLEKREFKVFHNTRYKINNVGLTKSYRIKRKDRKLYKMLINGVYISPSTINDNYVVFDFSVLREKYRDIIPMNEKEHEYVALETTFAFNGFAATHHYKYLDKDCFNHSIFINSDLEVFIIPVNWSPQFIELEEEYYVSDVHRDKIEEEKNSNVVQEIKPMDQME